MASTTVAASARVSHPLDPLSAEEVAAAWEILRTQRSLGSRTRVVSIALHEPPKDLVLALIRSIGTAGGTGYVL